MTTLKLEVGKSYRTRDGERVDINAPYSGDNYFLGNSPHGATLIYSADGFCYAFPSHNIISEWQDEPEKETIMDLDKITVRDYFAGCALQGILAGDTEGGLDPDQAAEIVMSMANALMKERGE